MFLLVLQRMLLEFVLDIVYFPIWWYIGGAEHALKFCIGLLRDANGMLAPGLWLKNIFVPMFGQYDWQGRIVSFFMRLANVIFRSIGLVIWFVIVMILFFMWVLFPMFVLYMLLTSFLSFENILS
ncbi:MAG: hypothetical protein HYV41_04535 [Candidatus Magasanikbacteria bacterium]|nr:hypothetical protein [Candidatus Magasanikbacteria bacterium]